MLNLDFHANMDRQEGLSINRALRFDGSNYTLWSMSLEVFLQSLGTYIWMAVVNVYKVPITPPTNVVDKKLYECNAKSKNTILS